jgi:hypothetical protein
VASPGDLAIRLKASISGSSYRRVASGLGSLQLGGHHVDHRAGVLYQGRDRQVGRVNDVEGTHLVVGGQHLGQGPRSRRGGRQGPRHAAL